MKKLSFSFILLLLTLITPGEAIEKPIDFNRDIRPILSKNCFYCHGPDEKDREAELRLDERESALEVGAIQPNKPSESSLIERIFSDDPDQLMPPPKTNYKLTDQQKELLKRWIASGAEYQKHWSFDLVKKLEPKSSSNPAYNQSPIDQFIFAQLKESGLQPSQRANKETLIRRLYLDLTGLPPTIEQIDAFLKDPSPDVYTKLVDQLLNSPHTAERLAAQWLDAARYADTNGYSIDDHREMWAWRDWVIHAFQQNMPYDQFVIQQLAGDLLPKATDQQKVATGFLRNAMNTHEGGTIAEEYRVATIVDQVDTVATVFMGLTMKCAQCHDHKYDPISQKDYYRFFAFFNTSAESGRGAKNGNTAPAIQVQSVLQNDQAFQESLKQRINALRYQKIVPTGPLAIAKQKWEDEYLSKHTNVPIKPTKKKKLITNKPFLFPTDKQKLPAWIWSDKEGKSEYAWFQKDFQLKTLPNEAKMFITCDNEAEVWVNGKPAGKNPDWRKPSILNLQAHLKVGKNRIEVKGKDWAGGSLAALLAVIALTEQNKTTHIVTDNSWLAVNGQKPKTPTDLKKAFVIKPYGAAPWGNVFNTASNGFIR